MDITQFSQCLRELIEDNDRVDVPHLGTFIAEYVPASFSDRRTTINPPFRKMGFRKGEISREDGAMFLEKIASSIGTDPDQASVELGWCLSRISSELESHKVCLLPGLGRMKANARKQLFFIPDDNLDIYPDGTGLEPVCMRVTESQPECAVCQPEPPVQEEAVTVKGEEQSPEKVFFEEAPQRRLSKVLHVVLAILVTVVALALILYVFRNNPSVSHLLDKMLYTEQELELLGR